jgi:anti-sigma factor RsiW
MSHRPELLSAMLDGELSDAEATWVAEHLGGCVQCRAEMEDLAGARAAVRSLPLLDLPHDLDVAVPLGLGGGTVSTLPRRMAVAVTSVAAAAVVGVGALGLVGMSSEPGPAIDVTEVGSILAATSSLPLSDSSEVGFLLAADSRARYSARQTTMCRGEDGLAETTVDIARFGGFTVMSDPLSMLKVLGGGSVSTGPATGPIETVTVTGPVPPLGDYSIVSVAVDDNRDRPTEVVTLARGGVERARMWIDEETGVVIHREVLDGDGSVACVLDLVEFEPIDPHIQASVPFDIRAEVVEHVYEPVAGSFPASLAGLELAAVYEASGGEVGVYGDGLFTIAVVRIEGGMAGAETPELNSMQTTVWRSDGAAWAVVGSLPDDLMAEVRAGLPEPTRSNPIVDGWRVLFG